MIEDVIKLAEDKMKKSVEAARHEFTQIRTGRANPAMVEEIKVNYYGSDLDLQQVASVTVPDPRQLLITPFDKNALGSIEKAIQKSEINLTPTNDGQAIRINIPPLTEERRKEFIKQLHKKAEHGHAAIRNIRHEANNHLKTMTKNKEISEDEEKRAHDRVQKLTDQYIADIDKATKIKEQELMEV
jgi:ribosome recycling factor